MSTAQLEDQALATLSVTFRGATRDCGIWDKREGGTGDSEERTYYPGGRQQMESLGGRQTIETVTLTRAWKLDRDPQLRGFLLAGRGKARVTVTEHDLDDNDQPTGKATTWAGTLKSYAPPAHDSEGSDPRMVVVEVTPDRIVG